MLFGASIYHIFIVQANKQKRMVFILKHYVNLNHFYISMMLLGLFYKLTSSLFAKIAFSSKLSLLKKAWCFKRIVCRLCFIVSVKLYTLYINRI